MSKPTKKPKLTEAQQAALQIVNDGGVLVRVSGRFGGWLLKDKDGNRHPIRSTTASAITGLLQYDCSQLSVTRYRAKALEANQ